MHNSPEAALSLADWIRAHAPSQPDLLTHLKLQKLAFYCYGALLAFDYETDFGQVEFQAWKHGPVSPVVYNQYKAFKSSPITGEVDAPTLSPEICVALKHVLNVYGRLTAWQLREESHAAGPWSASYTGEHFEVISDSDMKKYFKEKFTENVQFPEQLFGGSSLMLDRIPVPSFASLAEMSDAASRILGAPAF